MADLKIYRDEAEIKKIYDKSKFVFGIDEVGVGEFFTPLIATAVYVPKDKLELLKNLGVKDSKLLSDEKIKNVFNDIKSHIQYASALISQKSYNILFTKFNANEIKFLAHAEAINNLRKKVKKSELLIIDAYVNSDPSFNKYYEKIIVSYKDLYGFSPWKEKIAILKKAESHYIEVAAASIVARYELLLQMQKMQEKFPKAKFNLASNKETLMLRDNFIKLYGKEKLPLVAKVVFKFKEDAKK